MTKRIAPEMAFQVLKQVFHLCFHDNEVFLAPCKKGDVETWAFCIKDPDNEEGMLPVLFLSAPDIGFDQDGDSAHSLRLHGNVDGLSVSPKFGDAIKETAH